MESTTVHRICPLCEAGCGLELTVEGRAVTKIRGDKADTFSEGYICPKGVALKDLDTDPDVLREPMIRDESGWRTATWDEAYEEIDAKLMPLIKEHGTNAVGMYLGNPGVHNIALALYTRGLIQAIGTTNRFSASTVDQFPKQLAAGMMFGSGLSIPVPDINRTDYLMISGANPLVSNGSLMTCPNFGERIRRVRDRGGKVVVIDPRVTKTAKAADEHLFIRPGSDAYFLFGIVQTIFEEGLASPGRLEEMAVGIEDVRELAAEFPPEVVAERCGIDAPTIRRIAREIAGAKSAAVYGRIGTCTQEFGTLASWLPEVIHYLTGNLDREGGAMFGLPAHGPENSKGNPGRGKGMRVGRKKSRVRQAPEIFGEFPSACMSEEMETPGKDQIRAMITVAGNPVLSTANGERLDAAFANLDFMVSFDIYLNETTRHANVILPGLSPFEECHYDIALSQLQVHNIARYSPKLFDPPEAQVREWEAVLRLIGIVSGMGPNADTAQLDTIGISQAIQREIKTPNSPIADRNVDEILKELEPRVGPDRILDFMMRTGPHGDAFGKNPGGLTLTKLEENPRGVDFGPMKPRLPEALRTASGMIELAPEVIVSDVRRLKEGLANMNGGPVLVGRRHLFTNNSWLNNLKPLQAGKAACSLQIHPDDAAALGLEPGSTAEVRSRVGKVEAPVEITDEIMPGVVSLPHGWGHVAPDMKMGVACAQPGINSNILTDEEAMDLPSGNSVLCGIPVSVAKVEAGQRSEEGVPAGVG